MDTITITFQIPLEDLNDSNIKILLKTLAIYKKGKNVNSNSKDDEKILDDAINEFADKMENVDLNKNTQNIFEKSKPKPEQPSKAQQDDRIPEIAIIFDRFKELMPKYTHEAINELKLEFENANKSDQILRSIIFTYLPMLMSDMDSENIIKLFEQILCKGYRCGNESISSTFIRILVGTMNKQKYTC
jgi:hypothetical protein